MGKGEGRKLTSHDTGDVDTWEVANAAAIVGRGLELGEYALGDLALADGVVVIPVAAMEDVDVLVGVIAIIAGADSSEGLGKGGISEEESGKDGAG